MTYATTLSHLGTLLERQEAEIQKLRAENRRLKIDKRLLLDRLNRPDALDAELQKDRALFWEEQARVLKLANARLAEAANRQGEK